MATSLVKIERDGNRVEVRMLDDDSLLAWCMIGDDDNLEKIADILSAKHLPADAMKLRQMAMDARRPAGQTKGVRLRG
jgi:hypothetical protein